MSNNNLDSESSSSFYPNTLIVKDISSLIDNQKFDDALHYLTNSLTEQQIYDNTWDLSTYLIHLAEQPTDKLCNQYELFSQDALIHVAKHGNPRELLIIMLEQSDRFISDDDYEFHIKLFSLIIRRLPLRASLMSSIHDILSLLKCHLTTLELPVINTDFLGKDLLIFNHDRRVVYLLDLTRLYVDFICQLRDYFASTTMTDLVPNLAKYLIDLLQEPLSALSYEPIEVQESSSFTSIRPILDCLFTLMPNPVQLIVSNEPSSQRQATLIYLLLTKTDYFSLLPCVYSAQFYLFLSIPSIQYFSEDHDRVMWMEKAAVLVSTVCSRFVPRKVFDQTILDHDQLHRLIDALKILMVRSPARQYAPLTIGAYRALFQAFDSHGRYAFLRQQLAKTTFAEDSYRTFLCTLLKDEFLHDYRSASSEIYKGAPLFQLLDQLCHLPNGIESDLLEIYDCLCSTLNFVRFIGLVDRRHVNRTLFWTDRLNHFNQTWLKPLRKSIDLARAHYKLEIKNRKDNRTKPDGQQPSMNAELLVDNKPLVVPNQQEQLESLHSAMTKFDILDCILGSLHDTFAGDL